MKKNIGSIDRAVRIIAALVVAALYFTGQLSGLTAGILMAIALIFILTSLVGTCPLYLPFGISTRKNKS